MPSNGRIASLIGPWRLIWLSVQGLDIPPPPFSSRPVSFSLRPWLQARKAHPLTRRQSTSMSSWKCSTPTGLPLFSALGAFETSPRPVSSSTHVSLSYTTLSLSCRADTPRPAEGFIAYENTTVVPSLVRQAYGKIVEIGTGPGNQMERYDPAVVDCIYGVDPNPRFGEAIAKRLKNHKLLDGKYRFVSCGIEDSDILETEGITEASMDTVISIQSLCAVHDVQIVMRQAFRLLKPGGRFIFWEHERSKDALTSIVQGAYRGLDCPRGRAWLTRHSLMESGVE